MSGVYILPGERMSYAILLTMLLEARTENGVHMWCCIRNRSVCVDGSFYYTSSADDYILCTCDDDDNGDRDYHHDDPTFPLSCVLLSSW